jgi:hypothetical protein
MSSLQLRFFSGYSSRFVFRSSRNGWHLLHHLALVLTSDDA